MVGWRKYPSSYPDFSTRPFCTTTLSFPLKWISHNRRSIEADNNSAERTLRRNSTKCAVPLSDCVLVNISHHNFDLTTLNQENKNLSCLASYSCKFCDVQ